MSPRTGTEPGRASCRVARRPRTLVLALLAALWYVGAPACGFLAFPGAAPVSCLARGNEPQHRCPCRPEPHAVSACCCAHPGQPGAMRASSCSGEQGQEALGPGGWSRSHPAAMTAPDPVGVPLAGPVEWLPAGGTAPRFAAPAPAPPPPRSS
jgi:hypothetical protein